MSAKNLVLQHRDGDRTISVLYLLLEVLVVSLQRLVLIITCTMGNTVLQCNELIIQAIPNILNCQLEFRYVHLEELFITFDVYKYCLFFQNVRDKHKEV